MSRAQRVAAEQSSESNAPERGDSHSWNGVNSRQTPLQHSAEMSSVSATPPPLPRSVLHAYVCAKLAIACLETLFSLFSIDLFLTVYSLSTRWFFIGQSVYIVWNAINDPLFAWFQDRATGAGAGVAGSSGGSAKVDALKYGGPLMGLAFLVPFLPLATLLGDGGEVAVGLHFLFALCFFDGVFTYACLAHCALFAEITTQASERMQVMRVGEVAMLATAPVVWLAQAAFDRSNLGPFRWFALGLAMLCGFVMWVAADYVKVVSSSNTSVNCADDGCASGGKLSAVVAATSSAASAGSSSGSSSTPSLRTFLVQFFSHRSILLFIGANFLQVFTLAFFNGFFTIIVDSIELDATAVGGDAAGTAAGGWTSSKSVALGFSQLLPPLLILALSVEESAESFVGSDVTSPAPSSLDRAYRVVRGLTFLKIALSFGMLLLGVSAPLLFLCYLFLTRALATTTFAFFTPLVSDCIDEDTVTWRRARPFSASFFGINALLTKPAQSIAPVLTVGLWNRFGFRAQHEGQAAGTSTEMIRDPIRSSPQADDLVRVVFLCCTVGPLLIGLVQAMLWSLYTLRGEKLKRVKQQLAVMQSGSEAAVDASSSPESLRLRSAEEGTTAATASSDESGQLLDKRRVTSKQS